METERNELLNQLLSEENMIEAYKQVKRNRGASGIDGMEVTELKEYLEEHGEEIKEEIRTRRYKPSPVRRVEIPKENGGVRLLGIPTVKDRMVQQMIVQVLTPIYEPIFSEHSYGFRPGRNCEMAIIKVLEHMNEGLHWIVDIDLEKFFDNVHHDKLIRLVSQQVKDGDVISLIRKFLRSGIMIDDEYKESTIGTPQGGNLSPLLSNIMLDVLDKELEARQLNFVRYADDVQILVGSQKAADRVIENVSSYIEKKLGLKVNMTKSKVNRPEDTKYLGFGFYYDKLQKTYKAKPHKLSVEKLKRKLKQLTSRNWGVSMDYRLLKIKQLIVGWVNYFRIASFKKVCKQIDAHTRFRLRMCIWKRWKRIGTKYRALIKLGVNKYKAWEWANSRKAYARVAMSYIMCRTVTNDRLKKRGLVSLLDQYQLKHILV